MKYLFFMVFISFASLSFAQRADAPPPNLIPLPEVPDGPGVQNDPALEPQITIIKRGTEQVEEYRIKGRLYMVKVTPSHGKSYYLIDHKGDGQFSRQDHLDSGVRVPQWVLFKF